MGTSFTFEECERHEDLGMPCKCCRFTDGVDLPIPAELTIDEVKVHARRFSHSILAGYTKLNAVLKRFEPIIQKRWMKKSSRQRKEILLKAWPGMSVTHRPDFVSFRRLKGRVARSRTCAADAFLWPYVNLEDLLKGHLLLLFINSRGRNLPEMFIAADMEEAHLGQGWDVKEGEHVDSAMVFTNGRSPRSYGRLENVGGEGASMSSKHCPRGTACPCRSGIAYPTRKGLIALEIQAGTYSFLLTCAKLILHDTEPKQYFLAPIQHRSGVPQPKSGDWPSLAAQALERPYRVPQQMDLDRLRTLVGARRSAAEDHMWMLQEDPAYFTDNLREWKEHNQRATEHSCNDCWCDVAGLLIGDAFVWQLLWNDIDRVFSRMPAIDVQLQRADKTTMRLATVDEVKWVTLLEIIDQMIDILIYHFVTCLPASPRMRGCYEALKPGETRVLPFLKTGLTDAAQRVGRLFHTIWDPRLSEMHSLNRIIQEVQYMLDTEAEASQLLDSWLLAYFSDLAMLSELKLRIEGLQPWCKMWTMAKVSEMPAVKSCVDSVIALVEDVQFTMSDACYTCKRLGDPMDGRFGYPADKRYTKEHVNQMRKAEESLYGYWVELDLLVEIATGNSVDDLLRSVSLHPRKLHRTPAWKEPLRLPAATSAAQSATALKEKDPNGWRADDYSNKKRQIEARSRAKVKTRGEASILSDGSPPSNGSPVTAENTSPLTPKIVLPKRAYATLSALFPLPSTLAHTPKEVSWDELLHALNALGLQPEKLYGSVWIFRPLPKGEGRVDVERSIQFHEPKQVRRGHKVPACMVRTFGRRLKHAFGWDGGMFGCE